MSPGAGVGTVVAGRRHELDRLRALIAKPPDGTTAASILTGPPGIGKTTLLSWSYEQAVAAGYLCASVRAPAAAGLPPRFPIGEILEDLVHACRARDFPLAHPLQRVLETLRGTSSGEPYPAQLPQIADAIEQTAMRAPVAIFIDDFHWAPAESAALLVGALRVIDVPFLFMIAGREGTDGFTPLPESTSELRFERIQLDGLDVEAVDELARATLGGPVLSSVLEDLHSRAVGNPLFMVELLRRWRDDRVVAEIGGHWAAQADIKREASPSLEEIIRTRLSRLNDEELFVFASLAVIGRDVRFEELRAVCGFEARALVGIISMLSDQGLVFTDQRRSPRYRIANPLFERALREKVGPTRSAEIHGRVFASLKLRKSTGHAVPVAALAHHAVASLEPPPETKELLEAAATEAATADSHEEAARWFGFLAEELEDDPPARARALEGQAKATANFHPHEAVDLFTEALELVSDLPQRARLHFGRATSHRNGGAFSHATADLQAATDHSPPGLLLEVRHAQSVLAGIQGRLEEARTGLTTLLEDAAGTGVHAKALGHLGQVAYTDGNTQEAVRLWREAEALTTDRSYSEHMNSNLAWIGIMTGDWSATRRLLHERIKETVRRGDIWNAHTYLCSAARLTAWMGNVPTSLEYAQKAIAFARRIGNPACRVTALDALACCLLEAGAARDAVKLLPEVYELVKEPIEPRELSFTFAVFSEAELAIGQLSAARALLTRAYEYLSQAPPIEIVLLRLRAQIEAAANDDPLSITIVNSISSSYRVFRFEWARARAVASQCNLRLGHREEAAAVGKVALQIFQELGAVRHADELERSLLATEPRKRGRPKSALQGGLTEREHEVLVLFAEGLSNQDIAEKLFLSAATIKKHLERIRGKLGVNKGSQLVMAALKAGLLDNRDPAVTQTND